MSTINVDVVSAEGQIFSGTANMIIAPAVSGEVGIAPQHTPLLTTLNSGEVRVLRDEGEEHIFVGGGILEVQPTHVTILADTAVRADDLDEAAAIAAKEAAERELEQRDSDQEVGIAQAELAIAAARLQFIDKMKKKR